MFQSYLRHYRKNDKNQEFNGNSNPLATTLQYNKRQHPLINQNTVGVQACTDHHPIVSQKRISTHSNYEQEPLFTHEVGNKHDFNIEVEIVDHSNGKGKKRAFDNSRSLIHFYKQRDKNHPKWGCDIESWSREQPSLREEPVAKILSDHQKKYMAARIRGRGRNSDFSI